MLSIVCGPFHPHLEHALADDLVAAKAQDPLAPLLVVVPSDALRRRIACLLAGECGRAFLNLSILTFHQLSRRLVEEATGRRSLDLINDHAFEELMRLRLGGLPAAGPFALVAATRGGCAALWQTLRDLKDAKVPPDTLAEAVAEGVFAPEDSPRLSALAELYRDVLAAAQAAGWVDYTDVDTRAAAAAPTSAFLKAQRAIAYYGFYDLTQAQYDVLRSVAAVAETTVYFPSVMGNPWWVFADRFLRRYLVGLSPRPVRVLDGPRPQPPATMVTCSGATDEAAACAKEILRLVEEQGVAFEEIGVIARTLEPYADVLARTFRRHGIPFVTTARRPLARFPQVQAALRLLRVAEGEPTREDVIDLLSSPWFRVDRLVAGAEAQPAFWDELARSVGVTSGYEGWERLAALSGPEGDAGEGFGSRGAQAARLLRLVNALRGACAPLPAVASGSAHAAAWVALLGALLGVSVDPEARDEKPGGETDVLAALVGAFQAPALLDPFQATMTRQAYLDAVRRAIEATALPTTDVHARGVLVADAAAARGVGFRAVFLLGLNDGLFPRVIREDAFLRDRDRRVIDTTLGYKIPEKLAGYDEEHLLFSALVQAGRDHLVLSSERADDAGRPLAPSWYLAAWREAAERPPTRVEVPRRPREKARFPPFDRIERQTPREAAVLAALVGAEVGTVADERTLAALTRARRFRAAVDGWSPSLSPFDGAVGPPVEWLAEARARGYTASALQTYAECPWRFFVTDLLGVVPPADAEQRAGPTVREWGALLHETLARAVGPGAPPVESIWREVCGRYAREAGIGYPLVWELEVERTGRILAEVVADDRDELTRSGYTSIEREVTLSGVWDGVRAIPIRGRLDRVDAGAGNGLRVIDWKFRWTRSRERPDDPETAALRGQALQAPLYAVLAQQYAGAAAPGVPGAPVVVSVYEVRLRAWEGAIERVRYAPGAEAAARIRATVLALVDGIEAGLFPMIPDTYCGRCDVAAACRRRHAPSRARAERDPRAARLAAIRRTPRRTGDGV